jgi:hypothetical protein
MSLLRILKSVRVPIVLLSVLLLSAFQAQSVAAQQAALRGFVTAAENEQALQGSSVALLQNGALIYGAASDGDGYFQINRIASGQYTLRISFIGYTAYEEELSISGGDIFERSVALEENQEEIDELVVEADAQAGIAAVVAGLESVAPADIERVLIPGVSGDLASFLQTLPGVVVQGDRGGQYFVRGGAPDQNLALIDGLPVYMPFHVLSFYSAFPEEVVDKADFYTGGYGAKYGTRVSSVTDVQARNGTKQNFAGSIALAPFMSSARIEGPLIKNRVSFLVSIRESLLETLTPEFFGQDLGYRLGDRFGKIHALLGNSHSLSAMILDTHDRGDIAGTKKSFDGETIPTTVSDSSEVAWTNRVYGGTYSFRSNKLPIVFNVTAGRSEMTNDFGPPDEPARESRVESTDINSNLSWLLRTGTLNAGFSYRDSDFAYRLDDNFQDLDADTLALTELNAYLDLNVNMFGNKLNFNPGIHYYGVTEGSRSSIDPRLRMTYLPSGPVGRHQINIAVGVYHQATTGLSDERDLGNLFMAWIPTPADAPLQRSVHAIAGYNLRLNTGFSLSIEGFYKDYSDLSVPIFSSFPSFTTDLRTADGRALGADFRLDVQTRPLSKGWTLDGYMSYGYSNVEYDTGTVVYHPSHDRPHSANFLVHIEKNALGFTVMTQVGTGLPFTSSGGFDKWMVLTPGVDVTQEPGQDRILYNDPYAERQPTYARTDVWMEKKIERGRQVTTLRAGIINVFNRQNLFYYDLFEFRRVDQLPITPSLGVKIEFR